MATNVVIPSLGLTMEEGVIVEWVRKAGDSVVKEEPVAVIETDKATAEVTAPEAGVLGGICAAVGDAIPVGQAIAVIYSEEEFAALNPSLQQEPDVSEQAAPQKPLDAPRPVSPVRIPDELLPAAPASRIIASPAARKRARELGIDLAQVPGTGPSGRILESNVREYCKREQAPRVHPQRGSDIPHTGMRRTIARRMTSSRQTTASVTIMMEARMDEAVRLRKQVNQGLQEQDYKMTYDALFAKAAALALRNHMIMQAQWDAEKLFVPNGVHIGVAVALPGGLVVPVIRDADAKSLFAIARDIDRLAGAARGGGLLPEHTEGGTFTISNLGMYPVSGFTPVINVPEGAILGIGAIRKTAVVEDDKLAIGQVAELSLTFDHRIVDGAPAAAFLAEIKGLLEMPYQLFLESEPRGETIERIGKRE